MRKTFVAGNWKMNMTIAESAELASTVAGGLSGDLDIDVAVIPQFLAIPKVVEVLSGSPISVGAQDVYFGQSGAFTGEISCQMLADAGCGFALVGHSERRHVLGETDELIRKKLDALLESGLQVILCVGEKIDEREAGKTEERLDIQIRAGLKGLSTEQMQAVTIAYEPVWAIGTGKTATTEQAQQAHAYIRGLITELFDEETAQAVRIQYGGSVKPKNAGELMAQPDVDGALVGGAALKADSFLGIINAV
ncbi:MAG: triose-phosphate isomerase [Deltaproteobacteria bacterium]|nr:triose-phosphate isomerase [Deltaproteobacteria bacterium]